jgi:dissimilatory sulfite reductase (desulfoviridin) alpha/beta subunit
MPDYSLLKKGGFMRQCQKDKFSLRLKIVGGNLGYKELQKISEVAQKYGKGYVHFTSRQGVEIPFISLNDIDAVKSSLEEEGVVPGVCGPRVRTITACQGNSICPSGLIETSKLAAELDKRYFGRELPHKFKIGITGCTNNCLKAEENDLGIKGAVLPEWKKEKCTYCGLCESVCHTKAITVDKDKNALEFFEDKCVYCGRCIKSCPSDSWSGKNGYLLSFGGMFGNQIKKGLNLLPILFKEDDLYKVADAVIKFFSENAKGGERMGKTIERVGVEKLAACLKGIV